MVLLLVARKTKVWFINNSELSISGLNSFLCNETQCVHRNSTHKKISHCLPNGLHTLVSVPAIMFIYRHFEPLIFNPVLHIETLMQGH